LDPDPGPTLSTPHHSFPRLLASKPREADKATHPPPPAMVGVAAGFAFAPAVRRVAYRPGAVLQSSAPSYSARVRAKARLLVVARYSSYERDGEEEEEEEFGGGGWGRRDRGPEPDYDPTLDIEQIQYGWLSFVGVLSLLHQNLNALGSITGTDARI
jgi:hypothetical protein